MNRVGLLLSLTLVTLAHATAAPAAERVRVVSAAELIQSAATSDGKRVQVQGEAIGDIMRAEDGHVWVNVLSDGTAVGLWVPESEASVIESLGDFDRTGTEVEALGVFNFACDRHHGDTDVHVTELSIVHEGRDREQPIGLWKLGAAALLATTAVAVGLRYRGERRRLS